MALREAVHDVKHEQASGQGLRHFWDFSCLYPLLSPDNLRATQDTFPRLGNPEQRRKLLTLALFSAEMTGSVSLLPPHVAEFHKEVEFEIRQGGAHQEALVTGWLTTSLNELDDFYEQLQRADPSEVAGLVAGFDIEQAIAAQLLAVPSTARRVRSWLDHGQIDIRPPKLKADFNAASGIFAEVLAALTRERPAPEKRDANLADAVAVHMLAHLNGLKEFPYPRFFSSSPALNRVLRRKAVAENFTYTCRDVHNFEFTSSIVRDTTYYYVRSIFPALNWHNSVKTPSADTKDVAERGAVASNPTGFDELAELSADLNQALSASQPGIVDTIFFQGRPIGELLAQMRIAGSKASLINVPTERLAEHLIGLRVQEASLSEAERARLTVTVRNELGAIALRANQDAATAAATVSACTLIAEQLKRLTRNHDEIDKLEAVAFVQAELFAYRWSYSSIEPAYAEALYDIAFPARGSESATNPASHIIPFAAPSALGKPGPARWQWLATLYSMELFELVDDFADHAVISSADTTSSLIVLAARCRLAEKRRDSGALATHRDAICKLWQESSPYERDELLLGFGSALLHSRLNWQAALGSQDDRFNWPECKKFGDHAVARAQYLADRPAYRFVVNFICVLNLYGQVADDDARNFWPILRTFAAQRAEGSYRMMDTLALQKFVTALRALDADRSDAKALELLGSARNDLRRLLRRRHSTLVAEHYELVDEIYKLQVGRGS